MKSPREIKLEKCLEKTLKDLDKMFEDFVELKHRYGYHCPAKHCPTLDGIKRSERSINRIQRALKNGGGK